MAYGILAKAIAGGADGGQQANMEAMRAEIMAERDATLNKYATQMQTGVVQPFQAQQQQNLLEERGRESDRRWNAYDERTKSLKDRAVLAAKTPVFRQQIDALVKSGMTEEDATRVVVMKENVSPRDRMKLAQNLMRMTDARGRPLYGSLDSALQAVDGQIHSATHGQEQPTSPKVSQGAINNSSYAGPVSGYADMVTPAAKTPVGAPDYRSLYLTPEEMQPDAEQGDDE